MSMWKENAAVSLLRIHQSWELHHLLDDRRRENNSIMADDDDDDNDSDYIDDRTNYSNNSTPEVDLRKRRQNQLNPKIKISEITKPIKTHISEKERKNVPKRSEVFKFHCEGDIVGHDQAEGKHVEWKASFDRPIEQLIYPSLQRFDNETFEEKRKAHQLLHGSQDSGFSGPGGNSLGQANYYSDGLKIDLLPEAEHVSPQLMYLHTPKWTLTLSPIKSKGDANGIAFPPTLTSASSSHLSPPRSLLEVIDTEGEKHLRKQLKIRYEISLEQAIQEKKEQEMLASPFYVDINKRSKSSSGRATPLSDSGDRVYANLVERAKNQDLASSAMNRLTELSPTEKAYHEQGKAVKELVPSDQEHLLHGMLYYRVRNQLNTSRMKELEALQQKRMTHLVHSSSYNPSRKASNTFSRRLSALKSTQTSARSSAIAPNLHEIHALRDEDGLTLTSSLLNQLPDLQTIHLTRLNRAVANKLTGLDKQLRTGKDRGEKLRPVSGGLYSSQRKEEKYLAEISKREAQDKLILHQLDAGLLPETFIKSNTEAGALTINLSKYGIGDERGLCLGKCLEGLTHLESLGLSDNRLTEVSLPTIIKHANFSSLMHLDLSFNDMHDQGAKAIAHHFRHPGNVLHYLDLCNCNLNCSDIAVICANLKAYANLLEEMHLSSNKIAGSGAAEICGFLSSSMCKLENLDISWNTVGDVGAIEFAQILGKDNRSLIRLNLSANAISDHGGQRFMDSIGFNTSLKEISLCQNNLSDRTCFVVAQVLPNHPSMNKLDLSLNPLGEAGARSIFRTILRGLRCFVIMRNCSYADNAYIYSHTYPSHNNPYVLDLSEPYNRAVVYELLYKYQEDPTHCSFENMVYKEAPKTSDAHIQLAINPDLEGKCKTTVGSNYLVNKVCLKTTNELYVVPRTGTLKFNFVQAVFVPTMNNIVGNQALNVLQIIVEKAQSENDKKMWLFLICQDLYFTTYQAQNMIARFKENRTIGAGGLTCLDLLKSLWKFLVDTENMFDFLVANADGDQRKDLVYALTLKRYRFNWSNPTGHWTLSLNDKSQRAIMMQIIAINNYESEYSKISSGRQDTSQLGNWYNFRNGQYSVNGMTTEIAIDKDFVKNLPDTGTLDFDYVSTTRPQAHVLNSSAAAFTTASRSQDEVNTAERGIALTQSEEHGDDISTNALIPPTGSTRQPFHNIRRSVMSQQLHQMIKVIGDDEFYGFMKKVGLSSRSKTSSAHAIFILMDLQLAGTKYYFSAVQINILLDSFQDSWDIQSKVVVAMFSRIKDLHNVDLILRNLHSNAQQDIIKRLGCLNLMNPLKISFDYVLSMKYLDHRILVVTLMELASIESADQIQEDPHTELPIQTLYGSYTRALNEVRPEVMSFTFCDFGVRTNNVSWPTRRELLKKFLIGTQPLDEEVFKVVTMFKEMEAVNALSRGPIDLQYASFQKANKPTAGRTTKTTKSLVSAMKQIQNTRKSM